VEHVEVDEALRVLPPGKLDLDASYAVLLRDLRVLRGSVVARASSQLRVEW
jgi:hypothetical protein